MPPREPVDVRFASYRCVSFKCALDIEARVQHFSLLRSSPLRLARRAGALRPLTEASAPIDRARARDSQFFPARFSPFAGFAPPRADSIGEIAHARVKNG